MSYVFQRNDEGLYTVGVFVGSDRLWGLVDVETEAMALCWIRWLNGGDAQVPPRKEK